MEVCSRSAVYLDMEEFAAAHVPDTIRLSAAMDLEKNIPACAGISLEQSACTSSSVSMDLYDLSDSLFCHLLSYILSMEIYSSLVLLRNSHPCTEV